MTGISLTAAQVPTLRGFKANDRLTLVATADPYAGPLAPKGVAVPDSARREAHARQELGGVTRTLVEGALVIEAMPDGRPNARDEAFLAVPLEAYEALLTALNNGVEITALAQSRNPEARPMALPEPPEPEPLETLRIQNGDKTQTIVVTKDAGAAR
jgi:hypothetical protein